jgi:hypothetical protein
MKMMIDFWCFNTTFNNVSTISWRPVLVVEEAGVKIIEFFTCTQIKVNEQ